MVETASVPVDVKTSELIVSEIFGPTVQGEGPSLGRRTAFLRLGICNLRCTFCDTKYTWDWNNYNHSNELSRLSIDDVLDCLRKLDTGMVVITGGEPLLQKKKLVDMLRVISAGWGWRVEVETAGTISPSGLESFVTQFNVSPKLYNSGNPLGKRFKPEVLQEFNKLPAIFKFVVGNLNDLEEVEYVVGKAGIDSSKVYIMPEGVTSDKINSTLSKVADRAVFKGWNVTTRLHVLLWGNKRGV